MITLDYIAGIYDGEGSSIVRFRKDSRYRTGVQIDPHINITNTNKEVLELIKSYFGYGYIYWHKRDELWYYNIYKKDQLIDFTETLIPYTIIKRKELEIFLKIMKMMKQKEHLTLSGLEIIHNLWCERRS